MQAVYFSTAILDLITSHITHSQVVAQITVAHSDRAFQNRQERGTLVAALHASRHKRQVSE